VGFEEELALIFARQNLEYDGHDVAAAVEGLKLNSLPQTVRLTRFQVAPQASLVKGAGLRRHDEVAQRLTQGLLRSVTEEPLGQRTPAADLTLAIHDNGELHLRKFEPRSEQPSW
jgi:hypothetical protein